MLLKLFFIPVSVKRELKYKIVFYFILLFFIPQSVFSQTSYRFTKYTQQDGLASSTIVRIAKDSSGFIWLLSENGLTRFDGYEFKVFQHKLNDSTSISSSIVATMWIDPDKNILFKTGNSICKYDPERGTFKNLLSYSSSDIVRFTMIGVTGSWVITGRFLIYVNATKEKLKYYQFPGDFILNVPYQASCFNEKIIFAGNSSLLQFNTKEGKFSDTRIPYGINPAKHNYFYPLFFFRHNPESVNFLSEEGLFKLDTNKNIFTRYAGLDVTIKDFYNYVGLAFIKDRYQIIAMRYNNIYSLDIETGKIKVIQLNETGSGKEQIAIFSVVSDGEGMAWITTSNAGIFKVDPVNGTSKKISDINDPLHYNYPQNTEFFLKDDQILWFSSPGAGLIKGEAYNPAFSSYTPYDKKNLKHSSLSENVRSICELDSQNLLIATLDGLFQFNRKTHHFSPVLSPADGKPILENNSISKIFVDSSNRVWICDWHKKGVFILDYKNKKVNRIVPDDAGHTPFNSIRSMLLDSHGYLWLGMDADFIYRIDSKKINFDKTSTPIFEKINSSFLKNKDLIFNLVFAISENTNGQILIGTQNGFYIYDYPTNSYKRFINNPKDLSSLHENNIRTFCTDKKNRLWIGTNGGGLNYFNEQSGTFKYYTTENGLPDNSIYSITEDDHGYLWLGTNKGLCKFDPEKITCRNFTPEDGIQNYEFNTKAAFKTADGYIVAGGISGFTIFYPDSIPISAGNYPLVITDIKLFDQEILLPEKETHLKYNQNYLSFQYAYLNYFRNKENQYAYKLDGLDKDWVYCGDRRYTSYANLAPGTYTFRFKSAGYTGIWNESKNSYTFIIGTAWWNTWYFRIISILIFLSIIYLFYLYRARQATNMQLVRNRIARDLHDEVGSNLSSISIFSEVAREKSGQDHDDIKPLLTKISSYTQSSMDAISDIVWVINSQNDRFENITVRMRTLAAEIIESLGCELHFQFDDRLNKIKMGMEQRKNFYLIYKEALNNIAKYADCKQLHIEIAQTQHHIVLKIKDDGIGFNITKIRKGNGLVNMQKRAESLGGTFSVLSAEGEGTTIKLEFSPS